MNDAPICESSTFSTIVNGIGIKKKIASAPAKAMAKSMK
jgi:hypothetical protein